LLSWCSATITHSVDNFQYNDQKRGETLIYKIVHRKLKTEQNHNMNSVPRNGQQSAVPVPLVTPVTLLLNDTNIILYGNRVGHQYT